MTKKVHFEIPRGLALRSSEDSWFSEVSMFENGVGALSAQCEELDRHRFG